MLMWVKGSKSPPAAARSAAIKSKHNNHSPFFLVLLGVCNNWEKSKVFISWHVSWLIVSLHFTKKNVQHKIEVTLSSTVEHPI